MNAKQLILVFFFRFFLSAEKYRAMAFRSNLKNGFKKLSSLVPESQITFLGKTRISYKFQSTFWQSKQNYRLHAAWQTEIDMQLSTCSVTLKFLGHVTAKKNCRSDLPFYSVSTFFFLKCKNVFFSSHSVCRHDSARRVLIIITLIWKFLASKRSWAFWICTSERYELDQLKHPYVAWKIQKIEQLLRKSNEDLKVEVYVWAVQIRPKTTRILE